MTFQGDPYRTLGLAPGASVNEIRSAYRRLAKRYHPDAAGERALARFLAIQAAYEALVDPNGNLRRRAPGAWAPRRPAGPARPAPPGASSGPGAPDTDGAGASRDAWRNRGRPATGPAPGRRPASGSSGSGGSGGSGGASSGDGSTRAGAAGSSGKGGTGSQDGRGEAHPHRRYRRTATQGSTTYDEAGEATLDPEWDGGTWYGASSGTYWTLNPREYADPRKHGPEYRRRAWRAAGHRSRDGAHAGAGRADAASEPDERPPDERPPAGRTTGQAGPQPGSPVSPDIPEGEVASPEVDVLAVMAVPQRLVGIAEGGVPGRAAVAALAAAPALVLAWVVLGSLADCSSTGCPPLVPALAVIAWVVAWLVLSAIPVASALGAFAAVVGGAAALCSGALVATTSGDLVGGVLGASATVGVVLYAFALVVGAAWLYGGRERSSPGP